MTSDAADRDAAVLGLDHALEELRHATFGFYGPALRLHVQAETAWPWSAPHYRLLRAVEATAPLRPTVTELGAALLVDKARASRLVSQLQADGLVRRVTGRLDRRRREVELTDAGSDALADATRLRHRFVADVLAGWAAADVATLASLLERFNEGVRDHGP